MKPTTLQKLAGRLTGAHGAAFDIVVLTGQVADEDTLTINGVVYEMDDDATSTSGNIAVDISSNASAADDVDDIVAAILANQGDDVRAIDLGDEIAIISRKGQPFVTAESLTNATLLSGGGGYDGVNPYEDAALPTIQKRVPSAAEVTLGEMPFVFGKTPTHAIAFVNVTATGVVKAWDGGITISGELVLIGNGGSTDWAATDTVTVLATFD